MRVLSTLLLAGVLSFWVMADEPVISEHAQKTLEVYTRIVSRVPVKVFYDALDHWSIILREPGVWGINMIYSVTAPASPRAPTLGTLTPTSMWSCSKSERPLASN
ncbi:MAG: hypothetical protein QNK22_01950 [Xanthomonadales bacterium]|nr:hypothetical protein [Xanthomonadales bacterium]